MSVRPAKSDKLGLPVRLDFRPLRPLFGIAASIGAVMMIWPECNQRRPRAVAVRERGRAR